MGDYKQTTRETYDDIASDYSERDSVVIAESSEVKDALDEFVTFFKPGARILDVGSGGGRDSRYLAEKGLKVTAIDFSEHMVKNAQKLSSNIEYIQMDFEHINFPDESFEGIWANASLHHIPKVNLAAVLKSLYRITVPGGVLFLKVKHGDSEGMRENTKFGKSVKRYFSFYKPEEMVAIIEAAGFQVNKNYLTTSNEWLDVWAKK